MIYMKKSNDFKTNYNNIKELLNYINTGNKDTKLSEDNFIVTDKEDFVPSLFWEYRQFPKGEYLKIKLEDILSVLQKCSSSVLFSLEVELRFYNLTLTISKQTIQVEMKTDKLHNNSYKELIIDTHIILSLFGNTNFRELIWTYFVGMELEKYNLEYVDNIYSYASQIIFNKMDTKGEERGYIKNAMLTLLYSKFTIPPTFEYFYKYMLLMKEGLILQAQCSTENE